MIGRLHGTLLEKQPPYLLIDVNGVGYEVQAPMTTFYQLPALGETATLYTHLAVSETAQQLFGFAQERDRRLFRTLIKVSGVGPKLAVAILSGMETDDIVRCVRDDDVKALVRVPGVGKKTAERLMIELGDRLKQWELPRHDLLTPDVAPAPGNQDKDNQAEAESALIALGYKPTEAAKMIAAAVRQDPVAGSETLIRLALRSMVSG
ncbi:Holliday junction branch migration protein RuvA [Marinimicrobium alkaliphilum]|uniref:Holliday junction branch migration protein RuvA n=1 Tax=Marinimicrobium alkaliphilum TaxID=2202654 RepID=UPI000DB98C48|nr:Holliday junction branch migration protein RuvA [Marinimicrobium alkaliphilum]